MPTKWEGDDLSPFGPAVQACSDLVARGAGNQFEVGRLGDEGTPTWYAQAMWQGARFFVENQASSEAAADALAAKILWGARCRCGRAAVVGPHSSTSQELIDGAALCAWERRGVRWVPGCTVPPVELREGARPGDLKEIGRAFRERHG